MILKEIQNNPTGAEIARFANALFFFLIIRNLIVSKKLNALAMEDYLVVTANGNWYHLFYNLAFLSSLFILLYEGYNRKFPMLKWIFLLILTRLLFIAGTKVMTFSAGDFSVLFSRFQLPETAGKSLLGGLIFGGIALLAGSYLLRFKQNIADAFAVVLPFGIAIQRIGCFITGCCYGKISTLPWAVKYPVQTLPHFHQFNDKLISTNDFLSLAVHPVQLYEMALLLAGVFVILKFRKSFKSGGSLFLLSLVLIFAVRFTTEFFRDANAHTIGGEMISVFNATQLVLLPVTLFLIFLLLKREKTTIQSFSHSPANDFDLKQSFFLFFVLCVCFRMLQSWFVFSEIMAIMFTFAVAITLLGYRIIRHFWFTPYRWLYTAGFILPFILMAQTFPAGQQDSVFVKKYKTIKIGFATGDFENSHNIGQGEGCDRISNTEYFKQKYNLGAVAFEFTTDKPDEKQQYRYGVKAMYGNHAETRLSDNYETNNTLFGITPYVDLETTWIGIGGGLHVGNLIYITENQQIDGTGIPTSGSKSTFVYPQFYLRIGPPKWFFADYHLADHFPSALPGFRHQMGIGSGFGFNNGTNFRIGSNLGSMGYLSGYFVFDKKYVLEPMYVWGKSPRGESDKNFHQFSIGLGYRFGFTEGNSFKKTYKY